jgi:hypothetical protein
LQKATIYSSHFLVLRIQTKRPDVALGIEKTQGAINKARYLTFFGPKFEIYECAIPFIREVRII